MKPFFILSAVVLLFSFFFSSDLQASRAAGGLRAGDRFPELLFRHELSDSARKYLGLQKRFFPFLEKNEFSLGDIDADVVVIEFFNNYCTSCQAQAPVMNTIHAQIAGSPEVSGRVKFLGIGAGNNVREVTKFKNERDVRFPLLPDPDFVLYEAVGDPGGTPFTIIVKNIPSGAIVASAHMGLVKDTGFLVSEIHTALNTSPEDIRFLTAKQPGAPSEERMLSLDLNEEEKRSRVRQSMLNACGKGCSVTSLAEIHLTESGVVYRGRITSAGKDVILYSKVVSRKPVCDVCHGIHFIVTFNSDGAIADFAPIHLTKYGNVEWHENDVGFMRRKLLDRSLKKGYIFKPEADAVSMATMTSALIFNSINRLGTLVSELESIR